MKSSRRYRVTTTAAGVLTVGALAAGCVPDQGDNESSRTQDERIQMAEQWAQLTTPHEETGMTLLEGPVIGADDRLYVTDVTAPPGGPKVFALDLTDADAEPEVVYTDESSAITSAQFSPVDERLYLTDFAGGRILSLSPEGGDMEVVFSGDIDGRGMYPDDISFDAEGNLYVTDSTGFDKPYWEASGRVIRIDADTQEAAVLGEDFPAPNGIAFTPDFDGLWVSHNMSNQIDYFSLSEDGAEVTTAHPAIQVDGGQATVDSLAVDAEGHLYVGHHDRAAVNVYDPNGVLLETVEADQEDSGTDVSSATNLAIEEGTTNGYMTVSGDSGGYVYEFEALAEGIQQSNGG